MGRKSVFVVGFVVVVLGICITSSWFRGPRLPIKGQGFAAPGWNRVAEVFKRQVEDRFHEGGGFSVYHNGQLVMEFVGGYADYEAEWPWDKTTLSWLYSSTKGLGAIVIAMLVDRGLLEYSSPVAKYWPEFGQNGKDQITVEQLLSHQAGLITLSENYSLFDLISDPDKLSDLLASAKPQWMPGNAYGSHALTIGLYLDFLVRRVDPHHRSLDQFFADEVARKFGIDLFIGLPKEENYRCARIHGFSLMSLIDVLKTPACWKMAHAAFVNPHSNLRKTLNNVVEGNRNLFNNPTFREIPCSSMHGFGTVSSLAQLYGILANGGQHENHTLLSQYGVQKLNEVLVSGEDLVYLNNATFGRGTRIMKSLDGHNIFGYTGYGGQAGFADPKHRLGWSYVTNHMTIFGDADDWRYLQLVEAMYETVFEFEKWEKSKS